MNETVKNWHALDVHALCREGRSLSGQWPLAAMPRLRSGLQGDPDPGACVQGTVLGGQREVAVGAPEMSLQLSARCAVPLQCQRCLQTLQQELVVERRFRFARDEAEAARLDEEIEDDVIVLSARLDLPELLEDELILALPLVPRHEPVCPQPLVPPQADEAPPEERPHPFAALAVLRSGSSARTDADARAAADPADAAPAAVPGRPRARR